MKKILICVLISFLYNINSSFAQNSNPNNFLPALKLNDKKSNSSINSIPAPGAAIGFNMGLGSIEGDVAFAIGAFVELRAKGIAFVPQTNYWKAKEKQSNFEIAGLARYYFSGKDVFPYIDGGLGINFFSSEKDDFTKLSIIFGGGIEVMTISDSFSILLDGKYKLIVNDQGNLSCFIFTAGMKFPFK